MKESLPVGFQTAVFSTTCIVLPVKQPVWSTCIIILNIQDLEKVEALRRTMRDDAHVMTSIYMIVTCVLLVHRFQGKHANRRPNKTKHVRHKIEPQKRRKTNGAPRRLSKEARVIEKNKTERIIHNGSVKVKTNVLGRKTSIRKNRNNVTRSCVKYRYFRGLRLLMERTAYEVNWGKLCEGQMPGCTKNIKWYKTFWETFALFRAQLQSVRG